MSDPFSEKELQEIYSIYRGTGDAVYRNAIVERMLPTVKRLAAFHASLGRGPADEAESRAALEVIRALDGGGYDPDKGLLSTFLVPYMKRAMQHHDEDSIIHIPQGVKTRMYARARAARELHYGMHGTAVSNEAIDAATAEPASISFFGMDACGASKILPRGFPENGFNYDSLSSPVMSDDGDSQKSTTLADTIPDPFLWDPAEGSAECRRLLSLLTDQEKEVVVMSAIEEMTDKEIGEAIGLTGAGAARIRRAALKRMRAAHEGEVR